MKDLSTVSFIGSIGGRWQWPISQENSDFDKGDYNISVKGDVIGLSPRKRGQEAGKAIRRIKERSLE